MQYGQTLAGQTDRVVVIIDLLNHLEISELDQSDPLRVKVDRSVTKTEVGRWAELERDEAMKNAVVYDRLNLLKTIRQRVCRRRSMMLYRRFGGQRAGYAISFRGLISIHLRKAKNRYDSELSKYQQRKLIAISNLVIKYQVELMTCANAREVSSITQSKSDN